MEIKINITKNEFAVSVTGNEPIPSINEFDALCDSLWAKWKERWKTGKKEQATQTTPETTPPETTEKPLIETEEKKEPAETDKEDVQEIIPKRTGPVGRYNAIYSYIKENLMKMKPVDFTAEKISNLTTLYYKKNYNQTLSDSGQAYASLLIKRLMAEKIIRREPKKRGIHYQYNLWDSPVNEIPVEEVTPGKKEETPETIKEEPAEPPKEQKKSFQWTKERDNIIKNKFDELGPQGIFDKSLLPGFTLAEIRKRCQDLHLMTEFGTRPQ